MSDELDELLNSIPDTSDSKSDKGVSKLIKKEPESVKFSNMEIDGGILEKVSNLFESSRIKVTDDIPRPVPVIKLGGATIASLSDVTTLTGKAKSRKSYFLSAVITAALNPDYYGNNLQVVLPQERDHIIWIDTEQSDFWSQQILKRVHWSGVPEEIIDNRIHYYNCRSLSTQEICAFLYKAIEVHHHEASLCIIDGSRDLVDSINDEVEAKNLSRWLPELGKKYVMNLTNIIHQNPGGQDGSKVRGTLGTELMNKSEFIVEIKKHPNDKDISTVGAMMSRDIEADEQCFEIIEGVLQFTDAPVETREGKAKFLYELDVQSLKDITKATFGLKTSLSQAKLKVSIKESLLNTYQHDVGVQKIVDEWIPFFENKGLIKLASKKGAGNGRAKIYEKSKFSETETIKTESFETEELDDLPF